MKIAEKAFLVEQFKSQVADLTGDALLDKWIDFKGSEASKVPDLGLLKGQVLQARLAAEFGLMWYKAVDARKAQQKEVAPDSEA